MPRTPTTTRPRRAVLVALAASTLASVLLSGCANPHARRPAAESRPGLTPTTARVRFDATSALVRTDAPGPEVYTPPLVRDRMVGFRREPDGSVSAVAGGLSLALSEGNYAWVIPKGLAPSWRDR